VSGLPAHASVVVIGGGVVGAATARHLGTLGCRDAILLERATIGSGTTWHAAGNMETWRADPLIGEMVAYAVRLFPELERETGVSFGWRQTGRIHFTADEHLMGAYRAGPARARARGVEVQCLSAGEIADRLPIISTDGLLGGLWTPNDGRVDPTNLAMAHARGAAQHGVKLFEDVAVRAICSSGGKVVAVATDQGEVRCDAVVLAAGLWSTTLARTCGIRLPLMALHHFYLLTKPIDGLSRDLPLFLSYDERIYGREDVGGLLMGVFDEDAIPLEPDELPERFSFSLLPENWDQIQPNMPVVLNRFPVLERAEIRMLVNGPESFTPDGEMLLGEHPELQGLHLATGMNSNGIALASGVGLLTAERLVHGRSSLDTTRLRVDRFAPFQSGDRYRRVRMSEIPTWFCKAHGPGGDFVASRDIRRSPFHHRHLAQGAVLRTVVGLERPAFFEASAPGGTAGEQVAAELAMADSAAWSDRSGDTILWLEGVDAAELLRQLTAANGVTEPGRATVAPFLNEEGGIEALPIVLALGPDRFALLAGPEEGVGLERWIRRHLNGARVALVDVGAAYAMLDLFGVRVPELLAAWADRPVEVVPAW
jgi:4-methylaminobutanoate oxidase (formaldehyde-forming)